MTKGQIFSLVMLAVFTILFASVALVQSADPVPVCNPVTLCADTELGAAILGNNSYDPDGGPVDISISRKSQWSQQGFKTVTLTAKNIEGKTASSECKVFVVDCLPLVACPTPDGSPISLSGSGARLFNNSLVGQVCTLVKVSKNNEQIIPVGRSYDGNNWEPYAGEFAALRYECTTDNSCRVILPPLEGGYTYNLTSFAFTGLSADDEAARFLEQATFGPTRNEIRDIKLTGFAQWIKDQQSLPISSHRAHFRTRAAAKFEFPSPMGLATTACTKGTHYRRYAFSSKDRSRMMEIRSSEKSDKLILVVNNQARTVVDKVEGVFPDGKVVRFPPGSYRICGVVADEIGGQFLLTMPDLGCPEQQLFDGAPGNPPVKFTASDPPTNELLRLQGAVMLLDADLFDGNAQNLVVEDDLQDTQCQSIPNITGLPDHTVVGTTKDADGHTYYWLHSPVFTLETNTPDNPLPDGGGKVKALTDDGTIDEKYKVMCSNAPRTFLNEDYCTISVDPDACTARDTPDVIVPLELYTLETIYNATYNSSDGTRYIYAVVDLRQEIELNDPPCKPGSRSRWITVDECRQEQPINERTTSIFEGLIQRSDDGNRLLRDVYFPITGATCAPADEKKFDFKVKVDGQCWQNVHPDHFQVYDFTSWTRDHPGNTVDRNTITEFADLNDQFRLQFPSDHPMDRWNSNKQRFPNLGRLGDSVNFADFPRQLIRDDIASAFGAVSVAPAGGALVVCGSPFEVENDPITYGNAVNGSFDLATPYYKTTLPWDFPVQRSSVWMDLALNADDQLRQRVAWALSQILVVSPGAISTKDVTENLLTYYDIFVRHAFGNYRDILKEVSYSPMMAEMLSYLDSTSTAYQWTKLRLKAYADENYAREVMQLFSIGLVLLNQDGTPQVDNNSSLLTYTNDEIMEYARVWTGFSQQNARGNIEDDLGDGFASNQIDPMRININWRDPFPKLGLNRKYVGDGVPLCSDLPKQHFLKEGATFYFLGANPKPQRQSDPSGWEGAPPERFSLDSRSSLYQKLCNPVKKNGACQYKGKVVLDETISCFGGECDVDSLRSFEVEPGVFFEYIRPSCVQHAFYNNSKMIKTGPYETSFMCADASQEVASTTCCKSQLENNSTRLEIFSGERVSFETADQRCSVEGLELCSFPTVGDCDSGGGCDPDLYYWTSQACHVKAKIDLDGNVALVHQMDDDRVGWSDVSKLVQENSIMFFRVDWLTPIDELLADYAQTCLSLGCEKASDGLCICDTSIQDAQVFDAQSPPTADMVLGELHIGAFPQGGNGTLVNPGVVMFGNSVYSTETVFQVVDDNGVIQWRKNARSVVKLAKSGPQFRNPVHFISIPDPEVRDAHYETDATLDHYFYHQNTAPFLAIRLAQRFGISNPSPRFVTSIANAFRTGSYSHEDGKTTIFGSGTYGDLAATVAAILLDPESRSSILEADPAHGSIHEPFLRIVRVMRSLEYAPHAGKPFVTIGADLQDTIGQEPYKLPSVFSFFKPEFQPSGLIKNAGLTAPEAQVLNGPTAVNMVNSLLSLIKYGLNSCYGGFGTARESDCSKGNTDGSDGALSYAPDTSLTPSQVVDEIAALLTSGRLSQELRTSIETAYGTMKKDEDRQNALIDVQQLVVLSPEFHASGLVRQTELRRTAPEEPAESKKPYKAVVYFFLNGGYDSYNMLVPQECAAKNAAGKTVRQQYDEERGELAFLDSERELTIDASSSDQPCTSFAVHDELTLLKELYDDGELIFFANTGLIDESGLTKANYESKTTSELFAHNAMQEEARKVDPFNQAPGTGVLGRAADVLTGSGFMVNTVSIDTLSSAVNGQVEMGTPAPVVVSRNGVKGLAPRPVSEQDFKAPQLVLDFNKVTSPQSSLFGETWSEQLTTGFFQSLSLKSALDGAELLPAWDKSEPEDSLQANNKATFNTIAKLIKSHNSRGTDRDFFFASDDNYDHHSQMKVNIRPKFRAINYALSLFVEELKAQGVWEDVTVVVTSEFGRTLTPNSGLGADHAWGGHYWMMGGSLNGGQILGKYPDDLTEDGPLNIGRGRIIPTTSWDAIWNGVVEWLGVTSSQLDQCLPNRLNTVEDGFKLFTEGDLFKSRRRLRGR